jgi:CHASE1-domain containing sensor protein
MRTSHAWKTPSKHVRRLLKSFALQQQQQQQQRMLLLLLLAAAKQLAVPPPKAAAGSQAQCGDRACQQLLQQQSWARTYCLMIMSSKFQHSLQVLLLVLLGLTLLLAVLLLLLLA